MAASVGALTSALPEVTHKHELPLLPAILRAGFAAGRGSYLVYSNLDIALQAPAYVELGALLRRQPNVPISAIREEFERATPAFDLAEAATRRGRGLPHPGHDLWAFPRSWVPRLVLGNVTLGVSLIATALNQALLGHSGCRLTMLSRHLTYHVVEGESVVRHKWLQRARTDPLFYQTYAAWNCAHPRAALAELLTSSPSFRQCWFAAQVAKSIGAYRCGAHVSKLPSLTARELWNRPSTALAQAFPNLGGSTRK